MPDTAVHTIYKTEDGQRVPSVTTYLGILAKPALIGWAWNLGTQGVDYRKARDQAGNTGTLVHYLILCAIKGEEPDLSDCSPQELATAASPMKKFEEWRGGHKLEPVLMETPLVSEIRRYGGTPDFYGVDNGVMTLLDFKTSGDVYAENFHQLAAYKALLEEHDYPVDSARIIRLSKIIDESFDDRPAGNLENHFEIFLACQKIYELQKVVRRNRE